METATDMARTVFESSLTPAGLLDDAPIFETAAWMQGEEVGCIAVAFGFPSLSLTSFRFLVLWLFWLPLLVLASFVQVSFGLLGFFWLSLPTKVSVGLRLFGWVSAGCDSPSPSRNHVPMELASRIQRFVEHAHSQQQKKMSIKAAPQFTCGLDLKNQTPIPQDGP